MTQPKHPLKVFLCHAHADRDAVRKLYTRLTNDGVDAWLDKEKLLPGQDWELEIKKAVREADVVVVCLSKQFNQAGFRQKEVRLALDTAMEKPDGEIFIIPARLEECDNLESLRKWHWVDLFEDNGYEMLMRALRRRADNIGATLQIKKNWLPNISTPQKNDNPLEKKSNIKDPSPKPKWSRSAKISSVFALVVGIGILSAVYIVSSILDGGSVNSIDPTEIIDKDIPMRLVPAGEFEMGSTSENDEQPIHMVYLDAFYMDKYEVTNFQYKECVATLRCTPPQETNSFSRTNYYDNSEFYDYPVIYVSWSQAAVYCQWRGGSLPTEAQWEKAARSTDGRLYPWGEGFDCNKANYANCIGDTTIVGRYDNGQSPYGIYDLAGNVAEWTLDWYLNTYYKDSPTNNPLGPSSGQDRIVRGGSWNFSVGVLRASDRGRENPELGNNYTGFRCVKDAP